MNRNLVGAAVMAFAMALAWRVLSHTACADTTAMWIVLGIMGVGGLIYDTKEGIKNVIDGIKAWKGKDDA
jgi:hypothetical protein